EPRQIASVCQVLDTLALARELHPGQRNSLEALCKRYDVDDSARELHGALLDARILADVYLAMTGGQSALALTEQGAPPRGVEGSRPSRVPVRPAAPLAVLAATPEELEAHEAMLALITRESGGRCLWASEPVGAVLKRGAVVIYESTVYPGCTEEVCVPILERVSGLKFNRDFFAGYSPERINPGDREHRLTTIRKVTSGSTPEVADFVDELYSSIVTAGTHKTSSIRVAEAAKVIENTQRDVNIALINELALIFNRLEIDTEEVLNAAGS